MSLVNDFLRAYQHETGVAQDESSLALFQAREAQDKSPQATRGAQLAGTYRTGQALRAALGFPQKKEFEQARDDLGIGFMVKGAGERIGTTGRVLN